MARTRLDPYLTFNGNCAEAFRFYEQVLDARIEHLLTFGDSPISGQIPTSHADKVMHATLRLDASVVMGSDGPPGMEVQPMGGFSLSLNYPTPAAAKQAFDALAAEGNVVMPLDKTFWAAAFGMVTDRFGVPWMIGCEKEV